MFNKKGNRLTVCLSLAKDTIFDVDEKGTDNYLVITPSGNITPDTGTDFRSLLEKFLEKGFIHFRLDFHKVFDIDPMGLSTLFLLSTKLSREENVKLEIINVDKDLQQLFHLTRLDSIYRIYGKNEKRNFL
jgi:anti-anti-sigma factor